MTVSVLLLSKVTVERSIKVSEITSGSVQESGEIYGDTEVISRQNLRIVSLAYINIST